ncbi:pumilio homolog 12-like [Salvia miltiorrhiza]|uniref:pumilio homolog 12-like n=1 Tax=Salvia miltiorrhiza TaxID=226208 RepID=UPI0025ABA7C6|nr:pumilio homolog 12-like [Salvia miltiorrhiza]
MEPHIFENLCSSPFQPPEDFFTPEAYRFFPAANHRQTPLITESDQTIESAFSRLNLATNVRFRSQEASFHGHPAAVDVGGAASIPPPMAYGGSQQQQALNWAQTSSVNGPLGLPGARQNINVGSSFSGGGPYVHAGGHIHNQLINCYQRLDFCDANNSDDFDYHILHGKESRRYNVPVVPLARKNNSFANSLYTDQQLYKLAHHLTIENMIGKIVSLAKDLVWSSVLILKLEVGMSDNEIEMIVLEVMESCDDLLRNQFGSQFVHKLFAVCNEDQRTRIIMALTRVLTSICLNPSGAKAIQKLLEKLNTPQQISLVVASLIPDAFVLATDCNGQHIIHFCVKRFPGEYTKHLLKVIAENCFRIATNKSGCCVIQSCVENSRGETRERLVSEIIENAVQLAEDPYGNYVVQHLLGMKMQKVTIYLLRQFQGCFVSLSCNKYASNVVEKLLQSGEVVSATIVLELLRSPNASMLLVDPFGNFVIQNALSATKGRVFDSLVKLIQVNAASMQSNLYGKKILAWFDKKKP